MSDTASILSVVTNSFNQRLSLLKAIVEENSHTQNIAGVNKVQSMLEDIFWSLGLKTERHSCQNRGDILVAFTKAKPEEAKTPLLLVGHADTVHAASTDYRSFEDTGEILKGPGVFDMKAGLFVIILVLDALKELKVTPPLKIIINSSEEDSTGETTKKIRSLSQGAKGALVFEIGREKGGIVLERKGIVEIWCESEGKESHSGNNFYDGKNAILPLCRLALDAQRLVDKANDVTVNIAQFSGGSHLCVVPGKAKLGIEVRAGTSDALNKARQNIEALCKEYGVSMQVQTHTDPLNKTSQSEALFSAFCASAKKVGLEVTALPRVGGISDANLIAQAGVLAIDALGPEGGKAHTREEFVIKNTIIPRAAAVVQFLVDGWS